MTSLVLTSKRNLEISDVPINEHLGDDDVRIQISHVGICGSDIHYYLNGRIGDFVVREPMILGHEASGTIVEIGKNVKDLKIGDRVCMEPGIPNFQSEQTLNGIYNLDPDIKFWATPPVHGCFRTSVVHPAILTFKLPDNVGLEEGALVEPVSIGVYAAFRAKIKPADIALVYGAGTIGIVTALAALSSGCSKVILTDIKDGKLRLIENNYDANIVCVNTKHDELLPYIEKYAPKGVDIVFETSGAHAVYPSFMDFLKPGGKVVLIGMPSEPVPIDIVKAQVKEISFETIFRYRNMFPKTLHLISSGQLNVKPLVTHRYDFKQVIEAIEFASTFADDAIKIMVKM